MIENNTLAEARQAWGEARKALSPLQKLINQIELESGLNNLTAEEYEAAGDLRGREISESMGAVTQHLRNLQQLLG